MDFSHFSAVLLANLKSVQCIWICKYGKTSTGTFYCIGCIPIYSECQLSKQPWYVCLFSAQRFCFWQPKMSNPLQLLRPVAKRFCMWVCQLFFPVCGWVCACACVSVLVWRRGGEVNPNRQLNTVPVTPERCFALRWRPGWQLGRAETEPRGGCPASPLLYPSIPPFSVARSDKVGANVEKETQTGTGASFLSVAPAEASWKVCKWMMPPEICSIEKQVLKSFAKLNLTKTKLQCSVLHKARIIN